MSEQTTTATTTTDTSTADSLRHRGHKVGFILAACIGTDKHALATMLHRTGAMDMDTAVIVAHLLVEYRARTDADALWDELHHNRSMPRVAYAVAKTITEHDMQAARLTAVEHAKVSFGLWAWADGVRKASWYLPHRVDDITADGVRVIADYLWGIGRTGEDAADYYWHTLVMAHNLPHYDGTDRTFTSDTDRVDYCLDDVCLAGGYEDNLVPRFSRHLGRSNTAAIAGQVRYDLILLLTVEMCNWHVTNYFTAMINAVESDTFPQCLTLESALQAAYATLDDDTAYEHDFEHRMTLGMIRRIEDAMPARHQDRDYWALSLIHI